MIRVITAALDKSGKCEVLLDASAPADQHQQLLREIKASNGAAVPAWADQVVPFKHDSGEFWLRTTPAASPSEPKTIIEPKSKKGKQDK